LAGETNTNLFYKKVLKMCLYPKLLSAQCIDKQILVCGLYTLKSIFFMVLSNLIYIQNVLLLKILHVYIMLIVSCIKIIVCLFSLPSVGIYVKLYKLSTVPHP
jgi:hypothetical protein